MVVVPPGEEADSEEVVEEGEECVRGSLSRIVPGRFQAPGLKVSYQSYYWHGIR